MKLIRTFLWVALVSSLATHSAHGAALQWGGDGPVLKDRDGNLLPGSASPVDSGFIQLIEDVDGGGIDFDAGQPDGLPSSSSDAVRATSHVGKDVWLYADGWFSGDMYNNAQSGQVFYVRFFEQPSPDYAAGVIPSTGRYGQTTNPYTMGRLPIETWLITEIMRATFPDPITDPPTAPDTLAASALSASEIGVTWTDRSSNEDGFTLDRRESGTSAWVTVLSSGPDVEAFTDTVLAPATKYYYKVKAYNTDGESAYSNVGSATTDELPPTAPSALAAVALSTTEIKVTWNDTSSNEEGFRVRWSIDDFATSTAVELAADTTSYRHTGLNPDTTYYYKVKARHDTLGDSAYTPTVSEATPPDTALNTVEVRVNAGTDDAEERLADNSMYLNSSDLELTFESGGGGLDQAVGMRFTGVGIPQGATILNAYVQFQVDEVTTGPVALTIQGQNTDNAATFGAASADISSRPATAASVAWSPAAWDTVGAAGSAQRTPDLSTVLQEIVNRSGWASGNALAIIVTGSGKRTAEAFEGDPTGAALLHVEYSTSAGVVDARVASGNDDAEERLADNNMYLNSSDLELTEDGTGSQLIGMRFTGLAIPQGATIVNAHLQFKVDEITTGAVDLTIRGQAADNAAVFSSAAGNISSRALTATSVAWSPSDWTTVGESGAAQRTPDLAAVVQEIVSRAGWVSGNALAMIVSGTGRRTAESFNGDSAGAPLLHVEFSTGAEQLDLQVAAGTDDAEERLDDNSMYLNSSDLELAFESYGSGQDQAVGMRFTGVTVPQGATIVAAHLRFQVDEISTGAAALTIEGQAADNAATFTAASADISGRAKTASSVVWNPPDWGTVGEAGADQQTPDIAAVIQDIVSRPGWAAGNALAIVISGSGKRTAEAFEGDSAGAPVLHIEYVPGQVEPPAAFTAYNDLAWLAGQTTAKITTYTSPNDGGSLPASGALVDYDTGQTLGATLTVAGGDGIQSYGKHPASGTDAYGVFNGVVNCDGQLSYNATDDLVLTFAGLDPSLAYELVLYCDRSGNNYVDANSRYQVATLSGADGFVNQSTAGTEILTSAVADDTTKYNAGLNRLNGYVTRFVNIDPGSDGEIVLTVDRDSALMHYTYANAVMLKATPKSVQNFVAYNDLAWLSGQATAKITTYTTPSNSDGLPTSGALVDYNSGTTLGATLTVEGGGGGVQSYGQHPASGTDAYGVFNGVVDCDGQIGYSAADDLVLTFAGLDPSMAYELVLYCDRSGNNYVGADSRYQVATLSGADAFVNQSTAGTEILTTTAANDTTKYNAGYNTQNGYVTRFIDIDPGSDGRIVLTVDRDSALKYYTYANAVMLKSKAATAAAASSPSIAAAEPTEITASWGMAYFGTASVDPDADPDGDSASNREEWIAGTDPTDETSWFWLDIVSSLDEVIVSMDTIEVLDAEMFAGYGRCYTIEQKIGEDGEWTPIPGFHKRAASGGPAVYVLPGEEIAEPRFYRAKVCLDVD